MRAGPRSTVAAPASLERCRPSGFSIQLTTLDTRLTAAVNRSGAAAGVGVVVGVAANCAVRAAIIGETFIGPAAARARASANTAPLSASCCVEAGSGSGWIVRADVVLSRSTVVRDAMSLFDLDVSVPVGSSPGTSGSSSGTSGSSVGTSGSSVGSVGSSGRSAPRCRSALEMSGVDSSSGTSGSSAVSVDSVVSNVPVLVWALTTPSATVRVRGRRLDGGF